MEMLADVRLHWNGATLSARVEYGYGWMQLTRQPLPRIHRHAVALGGLDETAPVIVGGLLEQVGGRVERQLMDAADVMPPALFDLMVVTSGPSRELAQGEDSYPNQPF